MAKFKKRDVKIYDAFKIIKQPTTICTMQDGTYSIKELGDWIVIHSDGFIEFCSDSYFKEKFYPGDEESKKYYERNF